MGDRPFAATGEEISVLTHEVDSIGGAKPEPEERPAFVKTMLDSSTGELVQGGPGVGAFRPREMSVRHEFSTSELAGMIGKRCRNCAHFNLPLGQQLAEQEMRFGTVEDLDRWRLTIAELAMANPALAGDEYVRDIFAPMPAELEVLKIGLCCAMSSAGNNTFAHIDCPSCPSQEMTGQDLFQAKDADTERAINQARDKLLGTAAGIIR